MTNKQIIEVVQAAEAGKQIEFRPRDYSQWAPIIGISEPWDFMNNEYRVSIEPRVFKLVWWPNNLCQAGGHIDGESGWHVYNSSFLVKHPAWKIIRVREILD